MSEKIVPFGKTLFMEGAQLGGHSKKFNVSSKENNKSQLCQFERCQQWFLKNVFYVPKFAPGHLLLKISNLNSIESEIDLKNSCFWVV